MAVSSPARRSAFLAFAVLASHDTIVDSREPEAEFIHHARRVWGRKEPRGPESAE